MKFFFEKKLSFVSLSLVDDDKRFLVRVCLYFPVTFGNGRCITVYALWEVYDFISVNKVCLSIIKLISYQLRG